MITFFRCKSVSYRRPANAPPWLAGIEIPIAYTPLRPELRRVLVHMAFLNREEPQHEHRLQKVEYGTA